MKSVIVWDLPTRIFHWALAVCVILALIISARSGPIYTAHAVLGVSALMLALFRLVWGIVGNSHARFGNFIAGWATVRDYTIQLAKLAPPRCLGHNPLGGWSVVVLLVLTLLVAGTGVVTGGAFGVDLARSVRGFHESAGSLLQFMIFVHVAGVAVDWLLTHDNILAAMWYGRKQVAESEPAGDATGGSVWLAVAIAVPLLVLGGYLLTLIDLSSAPGRQHSQTQSESD